MSGPGFRTEVAGALAFGPPATPDRTAMFRPGVRRSDLGSKVRGSGEIDEARREGGEATDPFLKREGMAHGIGALGRRCLGSDRTPSARREGGEVTPPFPKREGMAHGSERSGDGAWAAVGSRATESPFPAWQDQDQEDPHEYRRTESGCASTTTRCRADTGV